MCNTSAIGFYGENKGKRRISSSPATPLYFSWPYPYFPPYASRRPRSFRSAPKPRPAGKRRYKNTHTDREPVERQKMRPLDKLISISSSSLGNDLTHSEATEKLSESRFNHLVDLYRSRNGFFAFESALHVFALDAPCKGYDLIDWNLPDGWRGAYTSVERLDNLTFFAEDIFGEQFGVSGSDVVRFNPETGRIAVLVQSIDEWAVLILGNYNEELGYSLAHEWQQKNGLLHPKHRLVPKTPFFMGGEYNEGNLYSIDAKRGMLLRADIFRQTKELPDGSQVRLKIQ